MRMPTHDLTVRRQIVDGIRTDGGGLPGQNPRKGMEQPLRRFAPRLN
jgi:hypothetical protein